MNRLTVTLLFVNAGLILALALFATVPQAWAQVVGGGADYLLMTGRMGKNYDAIYVLELNSQRLAAFRFDRTSKKLVVYKGREFTRDFRQPK